MGPFDFHPKDLPCPNRNFGKQGGHIVVIEPIQRPAKAIIIQVISGDPGSQEHLKGFIREKLRDQIELAIAEPQPIEDQRYRRRPDTHRCRHWGACRSRMAAIPISRQTSATMPK